jgi:hypothetical protein
MQLANQAFDKIIDLGWGSSSPWQRLHLIDQKSTSLMDGDLLDDVPAMSATVLGLEILLHEPVIDLRMAVDLVLSDLGATIQVLRMIGAGYDSHEERPYRMGDCLAILEAGAWFSAISAKTFACDRKHEQTTALWRHCRQIAEYSQFIAQSLGCVAPEEAYLVGLLHGIEDLPSVLGWPDGAPGALDAMEGALPLFVLDALRGANDPSSSSSWRFILTAAHELAAQQQEPTAMMVRDANSCGLYTY